jgi:hypothetical protein
MFLYKLLLNCCQMVTGNTRKPYIYKVLGLFAEERPLQAA